MKTYFVSLKDEDGHVIQDYVVQASAITDVVIESAASVEVTDITSILIFRIPPCEMELFSV